MSDDDYICQDESITILNDIKKQIETPYKKGGAKTKILHMKVEKIIRNIFMLTKYPLANNTEIIIGLYPIVSSIAGIITDFEEQYIKKLHHLLGFYFIYNKTDANSILLDLTSNSPSDSRIMILDHSDSDSEYEYEYEYETESNYESNQIVSIEKIFNELTLLKMAENNTNECSICLNTIIRGSIVRIITSCDHKFHQSCVDPWISLHKNCPNCRKIIKNFD